jgi:hypothetical protein
VIKGEAEVNSHGSWLRPSAAVAASAAVGVLRRPLRMHASPGGAPGEALCAKVGVREKRPRNGVARTIVPLRAVGPVQRREHWAEPGVAGRVLRRSAGWSWRARLGLLVWGSACAVQITEAGVI